MNEFWLNTLEFLGLAWWIEIVTEIPSCIYYFGPYATVEDAEIARPGFETDLKQEGAKGVRIKIRRFKPEQLTIFDESNESEGIGQLGSPNISAVLTRQA